MKNFSLYLIIVSISFVLCESISAQKYSKMKITLINGMSVDGKKGVLQQGNVHLMVSGTSTEYLLDDVSVILAKKGKVGKFAAGFGGGCLVICLIATAANPNDADVETLLLGSALWTIIFAGIGAGIGAIADPWKTVYVKNQQSSLLNRLDLSFSSNKKAPYNIGVVYKF
jgi:hypothetical protein